MTSVLVERLVRECGCARLDLQLHDAFVGQPGDCILFFTEDPGRFPESNDVAVILPELMQAFAQRFRVAVVARDAEQALQRRYGFKVWPALVFLRDGDYVGVITGILDWSAYLEEVQRLLEAGPTRPPGVGVAVEAEPAGGAPHG